MPFKYFNLDEELAKRKEVKKEDLNALMEWAEKQPHLPKIDLEQVFLFLHSCYYRSELTKTTIDNFYTMKTHCPEFFANRNPLGSELKFKRIFMFAVLPEFTKENYLVGYGRLMDTDPEKFTFPLLIKVIDMIAMLWLNLKGGNDGHVIIIDLKGLSFTHVTKIGLMQMKKFLTYLQEAMPVRLKGIHFVNIVPFMDTILALIKPFLKKELLDVLHLHTSNFETLYPYVQQTALPKDFGGKGKTILEMYEEHHKLLESYPDYFEMESKQFVDESKRPGKPKNEGDLFGVEGTFKKLDID